MRTPLDIVKDLNERISTNPDAIDLRSQNRKKYIGKKAKRAAVAVVALATVNAFTDGGVTGLTGSADRGLEFMLEGGNTESEGAVAGALRGIGNKISNFVPRFGSDASGAPSGTPNTIFVPGVLPELDACPTEVIEYTLGEGEYVSTAIYGLNRQFLPNGADVIVLDPLWANNFGFDNGGEDPNNPLDSDVYLRQLTSVDDCEIR